MSHTAVTCPQCGHRLKFSNPVSGGTKVKCSRCARIFLTQDDDGPSEGVTRPKSIRPPVPEARTRAERREEVDNDGGDEYDQAGQPQRRRPRKAQRRSKSTSALPFFLIMAGIVLVLLVGGAIAFIKYISGSMSWAEFSPPGGGFSVLMPGAPVSPRPNRWAVEPRRQRLVFLVGYEDFPAADPSKIEPAFDEGRNDALAATQGGRLVSERPLNLNGYPGREFVIQDAEGKVLRTQVYRGYLVGNRLFLLVVFRRYEGEFEEEVQKFFDSFKLVGSHPPPPASAGRGPAAGSAKANPVMAGAPPEQPMLNPQPHQPTRPPLAANADEVARAIYDLGSENTAIRIAAADRLAKMAPDDQHRAEVLKALQERLRDQNPFVGANAIKGLGAWGKDDVVPVLLDLLKKGEVFPRKAAAEALGKFKTEKVATALAELLGDIHVRHEVEASLKAMGSLGEQAVLKELTQGDPQTRAAACRMLGNIGTQASIAELEATAAHDEFVVRSAAKHALQVIKQRAGAKR